MEIWTEKQGNSLIEYSIVKSFLGSHQHVINSYSCPRAVVTNYRDVGGLKQQDFMLSWFWRRNVQNQGVAEPRSLWRLWESVWATPLPSFRCCQPPWHSWACRCIIPVSASIFTAFSRSGVSEGHQSRWIRSHSNSIWPSLDSVAGAKTLLLNNSHSQAGRLRLWHISLGGII